MDWKKNGSGYVLVLAVILLSHLAPAQKDQAQRVDQDPPGAIPGSAPQIAASGDSVYVTWVDDSKNVAPGNRTDVYFNRSLDGGASWEESDTRLNTDSPRTGRAGGVQIAASGDAVFVVWEDTRNDSGSFPRSDIYINRSLDRGASWLPKDVRIDTDVAGAAHSRWPQIEVSGASIYVTWLDLRSGSGSDVYFNRSNDGGDTWLAADTRINTSPPGIGPRDRPQIAASGDSVYISWRDERNGSGHFPATDIYFNRSLDGGDSWQTADSRIDGDAAGTGISQLPRMAASGDAVYVIWQDDRNDLSTTNRYEEIYFNRSLDRGATWHADAMRVDADAPPTARASDPQLAVSGNTIYVAWVDDRDYQAGVGGPGFVPGDIYFNRSLDQGSSWLDADLRLNSAGIDLDRSLSPSIAASGDSVYVSFINDRASGLFTRALNVFFNRSLDGGSSWLPSDVRMDTELPGDSDSSTPQIVSAGDSVYVAWFDMPNNSRPAGIYFNIPFGAQPFGDGSAGTGNEVPRLVGNDSLNIGSSFTLSITDALGGAFGFLALGGPDSKTSIPLAGGNLLIDPIDLIVPIRLEGALNAAGAGTLSINCPIPDEPALLGFNINLQALIIDPGSATGVAWTNGVEAWIL